MTEPLHVVCAVVGSDGAVYYLDPTVPVGLCRLQIWPVSCSTTVVARPPVETVVRDAMALTERWRPKATKKGKRRPEPMLSVLVRVLVVGTIALAAAARSCHLGFGERRCRGDVCEG